jgi:hypothetical protein
MISPAHSFFPPTQGWEWESSWDGSTHALFPPCGDIGQGTALPLADVSTSWSDGTSIKIGLQKKLMVPNTAGSHGLTVYSLHTGSLDSLEYLAPASVFKNYILIDYPVVNTMRRRLQIWITPLIFDKIQNPFWTCLVGPG